MMLRHIGEVVAADALHDALHTTYEEGEHLTADVGGSCSTNEFADRLAQRVSKLV
jgi:isocitrate/isopropylmalate dehydrogenase